jgi:hypothetical protein
MRACIVLLGCQRLQARKRATDNYCPGCVACRCPRGAAAAWKRTAKRASLERRRGVSSRCCFPRREPPLQSPRPQTPPPLPRATRLPRWGAWASSFLSGSDLARSARSPARCIRLCCPCPEVRCRRLRNADGAQRRGPRLLVSVRRPAQLQGCRIPRGRVQLRSWRAPQIQHRKSCGRPGGSRAGECSTSEQSRSCVALQPAQQGNQSLRKALLRLQV